MILIMQIFNQGYANDVIEVFSNFASLAVLQVIQHLPFFNIQFHFEAFPQQAFGDPQSKHFLIQLCELGFVNISINSVDNCLRILFAKNAMILITH